VQRLQSGMPVADPKQYDVETARLACARSVCDGAHLSDPSPLPSGGALVMLSHSGRDSVTCWWEPGLSVLRRPSNV
jgi:hypothetical protein